MALSGPLSPVYAALGESIIYLPFVVIYRKKTMTELTTRTEVVDELDGKFEGAAKLFGDVEKWTVEVHYPETEELKSALDEIWAGHYEVTDEFSDGAKIVALFNPN